MLQLNRKELSEFLGRPRSLRIYKVIEIPKGGIGALEFHKRRSEIITIEKGAFKLMLEHVSGTKKSVILREGVTYGIVGPFVLHTYVALSEKASLQVVSNTLYTREKVTTHDSYTERAFRKLQMTAHDRGMRSRRGFCLTRGADP